MKDSLDDRFTLLESLSGCISHLLRTPLGAVLNVVTDARDGLEPSKEDFDDALDSLSRIRVILDSLKDIASIRSRTESTHGDLSSLDSLVTYCQSVKHERVRYHLESELGERRLQISNEGFFKIITLIATYLESLSKSPSEPLSGEPASYPMVEAVITKGELESSVLLKCALEAGSSLSKKDAVALNQRKGLRSIAFSELLEKEESPMFLTLLALEILAKARNAKLSAGVENDGKFSISLLFLPPEASVSTAS